MAKEWILNQSMNRWGLNKKNSVGRVSELIRKCAPKKLEDWEGYYYEKVYPRPYLEELGRKLYVKITEVPDDWDRLYNVKKFLVRFLLFFQ